MKNKITIYVNNLFIILIIITITVDSTYNVNNATLKKLGLDQGQWNLFAPNLDKTNVKIKVDYQFENASKNKWVSPNWKNYSRLQKFRYHRHIAFYNNIRLDLNKKLWPNYAEHLKKLSRSKILTNIEICRLWQEVSLENKKIFKSNFKEFCFFNSDFK